MQSRKILATAAFIFLLLSFGYAQQNNIWYFGGSAGLNFNPAGSNPVIPEPIFDGRLNTYEGCATICDAGGKLLFYTNGRQVYNRNHVIMMNGDNLAGHPSAFQAAVIVRLPSSSDLYYVITADAYENDWAAGYNYSVVDMSQDGGLGAVVNKNLPLFAPGTERLMAARHANGVDAWIITNEMDSNVFRVYLLSCGGLDINNPVISTVGKVLNQDVAQNIGTIKVSPDGKHLAQAFRAPLLNIGVLENPFQLFDFDNATGIISNPKLIQSPALRYFSVEFSPNSKLVYVTSLTDPTIDQYDCTLPTAADVIASRYSISVPKGFYGIQMGPDKKLYVSHATQYLSVVSNPNQQGAGCNFQLDKVFLERASNIGLPSFANDLSYNPVADFPIQITDSCSGIVQFTGPTIFGPGTQYDWDFGDGNISNLANPTHTYSPADQFYTIKLKVRPPGSCGFIESSKRILPRGLITTVDYDYTAVCDSDYVRFTSDVYVYPDTAIVQLLWDFGDGNTSTMPNPIHSYATTGSFTVKLQLKTTTGCLDNSSTQIISLGKLDIQLTPQFQEIDAGQSVQLTVTGGANNFTWTPPAGLSDTHIANPVAKPTKNTWYKVTATNDAGCTDKDSMFIKIRPVPGIYVPTAFTPNNDGMNDIFKPIIGGAEFKLKEFTIYNRWGQKVFYTTKQDDGWDGRINGLPQSSGTYIWIVTATEKNTIVHKKKGTFVLIR